MYVRKNMSNVCPTLTANMGTGGHNVPLIYTDYGIRKLTPKECFKLQGFPEDFILPSDEPKYKIDLNTRQVKGPKFLSVQKDHAAETLYFKCARYLGNKDLINTACIIQYTDPDGDPHIYIIPFYFINDEDSDEIIIPWQLDAEATAKAGMLEYAFCFYNVDANSLKFDYCANTLPTKGEIKYGLDTITEIEDIYRNSGPLTQLIEAVQKLTADYNVYWLEVPE